jgi:hypothetical protein
LALSASKEIEPGARAMLLLADGLFRLDVVLSDDTIKTVVRNLSAGELTLHDPVDPGRPQGVVFAEAYALRPSGARIRFSLGTDDDVANVDARIGTLRFDDRGTVRVTVQATIRAG